jgi:hypothetical protein
LDDTFSAGQKIKFKETGNFYVYWKILVFHEAWFTLNWTGTDIGAPKLP